MDEDPSIASDMEWLRRLQHHPHLRSVCEACKGLEHRLGKLLEDGTPCALKAACAQILRERSLLSSFGTGPPAGILRDAENIMEKMTDGTYGTPSAIIGIDGNWVHEGAFAGEVVVVPRGFDPANVRSLRVGLADCAVYVCDHRPTVCELGRWGDTECLIVSSKGGSTSEELKFARMAYVNAVRLGFEALLQHARQVVIVRPGQGEVVVARSASRQKTTESLAKEDDPIPVSTEPTEEVIESLDDLNTRLSQARTPAEIYDVAKRLVSFAGSDSVQEKYRVGELLAKAVHENEKCVHILEDMTQSLDRQVRFTAARCMSKMAERQPELLPEDGIVTLLSKDLGDRSIPNLIIRALGKGKTHKHVRRILERIAKNPELSRVTREVAEFEDDNQPRNYYKK